MTQAATEPATDAGALKAAELLSTLGAAVLGAGLALLWPSLAKQAVPLLVVGALAHATGMGLKHRLQLGQAQPRWSRWLVALCWVALAVLAAALAWHIGFR
ncbi:hypothetical protein OOT46_26875 [Aquabacterium sp. A7-Y]|uniref:hypothetical protein n=1 Tax=Aquabacterium sp. A7-Y TaxID=1349605 RepID=UPI00223D3C00|nr:hypothetical protein [Aquabacterium sp. A7-Y]MCW7541437.1 hypothetical protein [Aquabacterium sp. A7-Y]